MLFVKNKKYLKPFFFNFCLILYLFVKLLLLVKIKINEKHVNFECAILFLKYFLFCICQTFFLKKKKKISNTFF